MIAYLTGQVLERANGSLVLLTSTGIGYRVHVANADVTPPHSQADAALWVHEHVTDAGTVLYGFTLRSELALFTALLAVSGVGPSRALAIVACGCDVRNVKSLTMVRGIGAATAAAIAEAMR